MSTRKICGAAIGMAVIFAITRFIQIPIPLGYLCIGNAVSLLLCIIIPSPYGVLQAALGSSLADLTSYPVYFVPTLIIKALMPLVFYCIIRGRTERRSVYLIAMGIATLIPLAGYTFTGMLIYGGVAAGLVQLPGLAVEYIINFVIFALLLRPVLKMRKGMEL